MARIAFFADDFAESDATDLASAHDTFARLNDDFLKVLATQNHEIQVITTADTICGPTWPEAVEVWRPFQKRPWRFAEVPKVLPFLARRPFEIYHFMQPSQSLRSNWLSAVSLLAPAARVVHRARVVVSLHDVTNGLHSLLLNCDAITVRDRRQKQSLEAWLRTKSRDVPVAVVAPPTQVPQASISIDALESNRAVIFIPGPITSLRQRAELFATMGEVLASNANVEVVFGLSWSGVTHLERRDLMLRLLSAARALSPAAEMSVGGRVRFTGSLDVATEVAWLARADLVFLAPFAPQSITLCRLVAAALNVGAPMVLTEEHIRFDLLPWRDREHVFVADENSASWGLNVSVALESSDLRASMRRSLPEFARSRLVDQPMNEINRIYAALLSNR